MTYHYLSIHRHCSSLRTTLNVSNPLTVPTTVIYSKMTLVYYLIGALNGSYSSMCPNVSISPSVSATIQLSTLTSSTIKKYCPKIVIKIWVFSSLVIFPGQFTMITSVPELTRCLVSSGEYSAELTPSLPKKHLFNVLVKSQISYCSEIWRPHLLKDIQTLENIQRRATKFILSDFSSDYKSRLLSLNMLPLMMQFELSDIMFFIKSLKELSDSFDILKYVTFCSGRTRSATFLKLKLPSVRTNLERHFYFNRLPRLWNSLPPISTVNSLYRIKSDLRKFLWSHFVTNFDPARPCSFHLVCPCSRCSHLPLSHNFN